MITICLTTLNPLNPQCPYIEMVFVTMCTSICINVSHGRISRFMIKIEKRRSAEMTSIAFAFWIRWGLADLQVMCMLKCDRVA